MSIFSFSSAVLLGLLQPFSKLVRNFSKRTNSNHYVLLPPPPLRWWQDDGWTAQKASIPASYSDASHYGSFLLSSGRRKDNVVLQLVPWFMLRSCRAFSFHFVKWMCDGFWQTVRQNVIETLPCCTQDYSCTVATAPFRPGKLFYIPHKQWWKNRDLLITNKDKGNTNRN